MRHAIARAGLVAAAIGLSATMGLANSLAGFEAYAAFGDSLSDDGNLYATQPFGTVLVPDPPYYQGRRTNGPVWPEYVAVGFEKRRLPNENYAYGFSNALPNDDLPLGLPLQVPDLPDQVDMFAVDAAKFAGRRTAVTIWSGNNDILTYAPFVDPEALGQAAAASVIASAMRLAALGVDHIALFTLPDFSKTPRYQLELPDQAEEVAAGSAAFNAALRALTPGLSAAGIGVSEIDTNAYFAALLLDPASFGVSNVTTPCLMPSPTGIEICDDPDNYAFYDGIHPTALIHRQIGLIAAAEIAPVPLPAPFALLIAGIAGLAGLRLRRLGKDGAVA